MNIVPVILAGGIGERFWPLSRSTNPKQLLSITSKRTMIEETFARVLGLQSKTTRPLVITGKTIASQMKSVLPKKLHYDLIAEPVGKNTAPAIALAAAWIHKKYGDSIMVVLPADHEVRPLAAFHEAVRYAATLAETRDMLVIFGIKPDRPETGYGYVQLGKTIESAGSLCSAQVKRFVEKPDQKTAQKYCTSSSYLWNSGMFVWKTSTILNEFQTYMPDLYSLASKAATSGFSLTAINKFYASAKKESIDYGIMEHSKRVCAVAGNFIWDDIGAWESLFRVFKANEAGTAKTGERIFERNSKNSLIVNKSALHVAVIGACNCAVITTDDAVLVIDRTHLDTIKKYLGEMKSEAVFSSKLF